MAIDQESTVEKLKTTSATRGRKRRVQRNEHDKARHKKPRLAANEAFPISAPMPPVDEIIEELEIRPAVDEVEEPIDAIVLDEDAEPLFHRSIRKGNFRYTADAKLNYSDSDAFAEVDAYLAFEEEKQKAPPCSASFGKEFKTTSFRWPVGCGDPVYVAEHDQEFDGPYNELFAAHDDYKPNFRRAPTLPRLKQ